MASMPASPGDEIPIHQKYRDCDQKNHKGDYAGSCHLSLESKRKRTIAPIAHPALAHFMRESEVMRDRISYGLVSPRLHAVYGASPRRSMISSDGRKSDLVASGLVKSLGEASLPLTNADDLDPLIDAIGDARGCGPIWMHDHNRRVPEDQQAGFYGLDVYSLWESMDAVVEYLTGVDPEFARTARYAYSCFEPFSQDAQEYARATAIVPMSCQNEAVAVLRELRSRAPEFREDGREAYFNAEQNASVTRGAELYYRTMVRGGPTSWNVRDHHMVDTLDRLMLHHGDRAKAIVWEHNTHVGDARFTDMARAGMVNVGQLVRQSHESEGVVLAGFVTHHGSVIAGREWGAPMRRMKVPDARYGSIEDLIHRAIDGGDALFVFDGSDDGGIEGLDAPLDNRAIGVVYDPRAERYGNYVPTIVPRRYDALLFVDETRAVDPLHMPVHTSGEELETFPSGM